MNFSFFNFFQCFLPYFTSSSVCFSFPWLSGFSPYTKSYTIKFFKFFSVFRVVHVKQWLCLLFQFLKFPCHNPGPTLCISHFSSFFLFLAIFDVLHCVFFFSRFFSFLALIQVLQCVFLIFHIYTVSRHILGLTVCESHFPPI